jgi:hypothetical protein
MVNVHRTTPDRPADIRSGAGARYTTEQKDLMKARRQEKLSLRRGLFNYKEGEQPAPEQSS